MLLCHDGEISSSVVFPLKLATVRYGDVLKTLCFFISSVFNILPDLTVSNFTGNCHTTSSVYTSLSISDPVMQKT